MATPVAALFAGPPLFDFAHEFVGYRIGDAMLTIYREFEFVRPVQGLPNAMLSQWIVRAMWQGFGLNPTEPTLVQLYCAAFFALAFGLATAIILCLGRHLDRAAALAALRRSASSAGIAVLVGLWIATGVAIKISLGGVALFALAELIRRRAALALLSAAAAAAAYLLILFAYMGFSRHHTLALLHFQIGFYIAPNSSRLYENGAAAALNAPILIAMAVLVLIGIALRWRSQTADCLCAVVWLAALGHLIAARPHDTSLASAALEITFMAALLLRTPGRLMAAATLLCVVGVATQSLNPLRWPTMMQAARADDPVPGRIEGVMFMPGNHWNAALPAQVFLYNGNLGHGAVAEKDGKLDYVAPHEAKRALFGDLVMMGASPAEMEMIVAALRRGLAVTWTRPERGAAEMQSLRTAIAAADATYSETYFRRHGKDWHFGRASMQ